MIEIELGPSVVGNTTLAFSPLGEVGCSLATLVRPQPYAPYRRWVGVVRPRMREVDAELLTLMVRGGKWMPSFLVPPVLSPQPSIQDQLDAVRDLAAEAIEADLVESWPEGLPPPLRRLVRRGPGAGPWLANELSSYWSLAIAPWWVRILGVLEDDVLYRAAQSLHHGLYALFADLHPRVGLGEDVLQLDMPAHESMRYCGSRLALVPSAFVSPGLVLNHDDPQVFCLTYGARGVGRLWEDLEDSGLDTDEPLSALLGRTRAQVLAALDVPMSTSQLAAQLGQSPPSINRHLSVLRSGGLAESWRAGRQVLYRHTRLGQSLVLATRVDAKRPGSTTAPS